MLKGYHESSFGEERVMKNSKKCPKWQSGDIVRVPGERAAGGAGNLIRVGFTVFNTVKPTRYLCGSCGFMEEWLDSVRDVAKVKAKYA
jgi:ribosomal protein S27AE